MCHGCSPSSASRTGPRRRSSRCRRAWSRWTRRWSVPARRLPGVDFEPSARAVEYLGRLQDFMDSHVYPAEPVYARQRRALTAAGRPHDLPAVVEELKERARACGLWNLFLPDCEDPAHGLSVLDYAPIAE